MRNKLKVRIVSLLSKNFIGVSLLTDEMKIDIIDNSDKYDIDQDHIAKIIASIKDHDKVLDIIENKPELLVGHIFDIAYKIHDDKVYWALINKFDDARRYLFFDLLDEIKSDKYNKLIIKNWEKFRLTPQDVKEKILMISDDRFKMNFIHNIDSYNFTDNKENLSDIIFEVVTSMSGDNVRKEFLNDYSQYPLDDRIKTRILMLIKDDEYKKEVFDNYTSFGYDKESIADIVATISSDKFKKNVIENSQQYGFSMSQIVTMLISLKDDKYKKSKFRSLMDSLGCNYKSINLPKVMTIGLEIESEGLNSRFIEKQTIMKGWTSKGDASLFSGVEVTSPILRPGESAVEDIYQVCKVLDLCGQKISDRCGGHIHVGADYLNDVESLKVFVELCSNVESLLYLIGNEKGNIPREGAERYSAPTSRIIEQAVERGSISFDKIEDIDIFAYKMKRLYGRHVGINFQNLGFDKNTIEFRIPNGSINPDTWIENINLFGGMVRAAKMISGIKKKDVYKVRKEEKVKLDLFEKISQLDISEEEKLKALLDLSVVEEEKQVYLDRYDENKKLIEGTIIDKQLKQSFHKKPIKITKKEIDVMQDMIKFKPLEEKGRTHLDQGDVNSVKSRR